eukprot:scaffold3621_cov114-Cylindrotheca_fusiformis.AAC.10
MCSVGLKFDGVSPTTMGIHSFPRIPTVAKYRTTDSINNNMKIAVVSFVALVVSSATAFAPSAAFTRGVSTQLFSDPEEEEEGLDLNLEEMFDMFDAADKEQNFDDALKKVKSEE